MTGSGVRAVAAGLAALALLLAAPAARAVEAGATAQGVPKGAAQGAVRGPPLWSLQVSPPGAAPGAAQGPAQGPAQASPPGAAQGAAQAAAQGAAQGVAAAQGAAAQGAAQAAEGPAWPIAVAVSARFLDLASLREAAGEMQATVELAFRWHDPRQVFDTVKLGTGRREFAGRAAAAELDRIWNPGLVVRNIVGAPRVDDLGLVITPRGEVTLVRNVEATFREPVDMEDFPFDRVGLAIEVTSSRYSTRDVVFRHGDAEDAMSSVTRSPRAPGWDLTGLTFEESRYTAWNGEPRELVTVRIAAERRSLPYFLRIFTPFFMVMMCPAFVLWTPDTNFFSKGTMIFSALLALVALSFTLENSFPGAISLQTPVSIILTSGFIYLVTALLLNLITMNPEAAWAKRHAPVAREVRSLIRWAVPLVMVTCWISLLLQAGL